MHEVRSIREVGYMMHVEFILMLNWRWQLLVAFIYSFPVD